MSQPDLVPLRFPFLKYCVSFTTVLLLLAMHFSSVSAATPRQSAAPATQTQLPGKTGFCLATEVTVHHLTAPTIRCRAGSKSGVHMPFAGTDSNCPASDLVLYWNSPINSPNNPTLCINGVGLLNLNQNFNGRNWNDQASAWWTGSSGVFFHQDINRGGNSAFEPGSSGGFNSPQGTFPLDAIGNDQLSSVDLTSTGQDNIIIVGGFNGQSSGSSAGYDCAQTFGSMINFIQQSHVINGQTMTWNPNNIQTIKYYSGDTNCTADLHDNTYASHCNSYMTGGEGTNDESIYHLSCLFAWYLYLNFNSENVEIVAHSMGGLIVRNAIYQVQQHKAATMPPTLPGISDVVTFATPHGGVVVVPCGCTQGREQQKGSSFMNEMFNSAQNPQAPNGTDWTLMGSDCDEAVDESEANWMTGGHKSYFSTPPCYHHADYINDTSTAFDTDLHWCDGCGTPNEFFSGWNEWKNAPHSLLHMMYALWLQTW